jgi:hypothetical protein
LPGQHQRGVHLRAHCKHQRHRHVHRQSRDYRAADTAANSGRQHHYGANYGDRICDAADAQSQLHDSPGNLLDQRNHADRHHHGAQFGFYSGEISANADSSGSAAGNDDHRSRDDEPRLAGEKFSGKTVSASGGSGWRALVRGLWWRQQHPAAGKRHAGGQLHGHDHRHTRSANGNDQRGHHRAVARHGKLSAVGFRRLREVHFVSRMSS